MSFRITCHYQDSTECDDGVYPDLESARRRVAEMRLDPVAYGSPQIVGVPDPVAEGPEPAPAPEPETRPMPVPPLDGVLPPGYRMRLRWIFLPIEIAGRTRRMETVRVVQRYMGTRWEDGDMMSPDVGGYWHDVGFWDEIYPKLSGARNDFTEL